MQQEHPMNIRTHLGLGPVTFGMTRDEVARAMGAVPRRFKKTVACTTLTDAFDPLGVQVFYDADDRVEALEVFAPSRPSFGDLDLFNTPYVMLLEAARALDPDVQEDELGFTSNALGFGVYAEHKDTDPERPSEGVIVFRKGYYEG
jgi:hypothetical protein